MARNVCSSCNLLVHHHFLIRCFRFSNRCDIRRLVLTVLRKLRRTPVLRRGIGILQILNLGMGILRKRCLRVRKPTWSTPASPSGNAYYNPNRKGNTDSNRLLRVTDLGTNCTHLVFNTVPLSCLVSHIQPL